MTAEQMRETYNLAYDHAYNGDDSPVGDDLRHEAGLAAVAKQAKTDALNMARRVVVEEIPSAAFGFSDVRYGDAFSDGAEAAMHAIDKLRAEESK